MPGRGGSGLAPREPVPGWVPELPLHCGHPALHTQPLPPPRPAAGAAGAAGHPAVSPAAGGGRAASGRYWVVVGYGTQGGLWHRGWGGYGTHRGVMTPRLGSMAHGGGYGSHGGGMAPMAGYVTQGGGYGTHGGIMAPTRGWVCHPEWGICHPIGDMGGGRIQHPEWGDMAPSGEVVGIQHPWGAGMASRREIGHPQWRVGAPRVGGYGSRVGVI